MAQFPTQDTGLYHLTRGGWVRRDKAPFPQDRVETWSYQSECPSEDAKERICLVRIWKDGHVTGDDRKTLRGLFGMPVELQTGRNITLECEV